MKKILGLIGIITLLTVTGCVVREHDHGEYERHEEVVAPVVVVRPPEVIVR